MPQVTFKVTKEVIQEALEASKRPEYTGPIDCVIARTIRKVYPEASCGYRYICGIHPMEWIDVPINAQELITKFDCAVRDKDYTVDLPEIEFTMDIPD